MESTGTIQVNDLRFMPLLAPAEVEARAKELGDALTQRYGTDNPLFIIVLSGAFVFAADLVRAFYGPCEIAFVKLASYAGTRSSGQVQTVIGLDKDLQGRHLVVVEDIVDTGRTLHFFLHHLRERQPASVCTVAFLRKPDAAEFPVPVDFVGFDIEDKFVVGYGLDYDGQGRNLAGIWQLEA